MSKVVLEIEDKEDGNVKTVAYPSFEALIQKLNSGHKLTPAEGYALAAINRIMEVSRDSEKLSNNIYIPPTLKKL